MTLNLKRLSMLEKELQKITSGNPCVGVLDTGALIDITQATRSYNLNGCGKEEKNPCYSTTSSFLGLISWMMPLIITPKTYQEIQEHGRMRLNSHITELSPRIVDYSLDRMLQSQEFVKDLVEGVEMDKARYDAYWASIHSCNGNSKKENERYSDTDKEILATAAYLSKCKIGTIPEKSIDTVVVLSSDAHVLLGSDFLSREFNGDYSKIFPLSTRY